VAKERQRSKEAEKQPLWYVEEKAEKSHLQRYNFLVYHLLITVIFGMNESMQCDVQKFCGKSDVSSLVMLNMYIQMGILYTTEIQYQIGESTQTKPDR
jgi:hypothetical protein